ncbi:hypothetical protein FN846DRAFT_993614 [Sphaerosporella brunnea]|uniref:Uncharacterized protein n=1 Tax=Sphaerosporella brunnea TaxID=1250544 RepID=A0A5J5ELX6_9PEZI|nr:hypothetical protein FN846DRAFT_993614 [Sphaerosporella brunnea]
MSLELENHFQANEVWLSNRGNHGKWSKALTERLIASKTLRDDEWFKKVLELGDRLGVDTAGNMVQALHSLHHLLKKKMDEKLRAQAKQDITATKKLTSDEKSEAADKELVVAKTLVDAADQIMAELQLIQHRTDGDLCEEEAANLRYNAAKAEDEMVAVNVEMARKVAALKLEAAEIVAAAAKDDAEAAALKWVREKLLSGQEVPGGSASTSPTPSASSVPSAASASSAPSTFSASSASAASGQHQAPRGRFFRPVRQFGHVCGPPIRPRR